MSRQLGRALHTNEITRKGSFIVHYITKKERGEERTKRRKKEHEEETEIARRPFRVHDIWQAAAA